MYFDILTVLEQVRRTAQTTQPVLDLGTIIGALWLASLILFIVAVLATGFTAKKIDNISGASYAKAWVAQFLISFTVPAGFFIFALYFQAHWIVALGITYLIIPMTVYKLVFSSLWREAALIWLVVTVVQTGVFFGLAVAGMVGLAELGGGQA